MNDAFQHVVVHGACRVEGADQKHGRPEQAKEDGGYVQASVSPEVLV